MTELANSPDVNSSWFLTKTRRRIELTETNRKLIEHIESALTTADLQEQANLLIDQLLLLPVDSPTLIAGLAFFAVTDGDLDLKAIGGGDAGKLLATLVRLSSADSAATTSALLQVRRNRRQSDNVRRMLVAMIDDPRVVVLKMVERLVRLHPKRFDESDASRRAAREVLHFYAPLASRLGIWQLKWVLEDFAFRCLQPDDYLDIASRFKERRSQREDLVSKIQSDLRWRLNEIGIHAEILGRAKNIYGIYRKMREKDIAFNDVHDVLAIRVIVDSVPECYQVLGVVHTSWPYIGEEFDDYIANPKSNGYRSLHTAVYGPQGRVLEVQIRTQEMHVDSELGVCSHWSYKGENDATLEDESIDWMREVLNWHAALDPIEASDAGSRENSDAERVTYVSTPQGHIVDLAAGSTALDFAFKVHTDIGLHCIGALVDGEEVALNTVLKTGQAVEILTQPRATPQRTWLDPDLQYFKTSKTRELLRGYFQVFDRTHNAKAGRDWVQQEIDRLNLKLTPEEAARALDFSSPDDLFIEVALGSMKARQMLVEIAQLQAEVSELLKTDDASKVTMQIHLSAQDRKNLIRDITREIAELNVNIVNLKLGAPKLGEEATADIWVQVSGLGEASLVIVSLRRLHRVSDVRLVGSN
ncbi:MAG: HD domain-containing protein [Gammaproteobacteria bacterium]|nr:HD domain-containing protein [Gammaproteobacteria bacterium]